MVHQGKAKMNEVEKDILTVKNLVEKEIEQGRNVARWLGQLQRTAREGKAFRSQDIIALYDAYQKNIQAGQASNEAIVALANHYFE